jgi:hypothetical protein
MFAGSVLRAGSSALLATALALFVAPQARAGTIVTVFSQAPNWALGSPQFVSVGGCLDRDNFFANSCGVGTSDTIRLQVPTRAGIFGTLFDNLAGEGPGGLLNNAGAIDLVIPNARWIFPRWFLFQDSPNEGNFASDALYYVNTATQAHLILISNNSDLDPSQLPSIDLIYPGTSSTLGTPTDLSSSLDTNGNFTVTMDNPLQESPEPSSMLLVLPVLAGIALARRRLHSS